MNKQSSGIFIPHVVRVTTSLRFFTLFIVGVVLLSAVSFGAIAQQNESYQKSIFDRAGKIVSNLGITDSVKYKKVQSVVADQYFALSKLQDENTAAIASVKQQQLEKDKEIAAIKTQEEKKVAQLMQLHNSYIAQLKAFLTEEQIDQVKDGMTYRVFPLTYAAYLDEIPNLTEEQKSKIYDWLKEARELAMDAESSDKKHAVFGKYKGRINNYLSAAGYDMKKEGEEWQKRIKEKEAAKKKES